MADNELGEIKANPEPPETVTSDKTPGNHSTNLTTGDLNAQAGGVINVAAGDIQYTQIIYNIQSSLVGEAEARDIESIPPEPGDPPFLGLQYFDEKDASRFYGRENLTARIIGRLHRNRFLAIIGASGSGKSSVVRAGVIPALKRGERLADGSLPPTDSGQWEYRTMAPGAHPLETLATLLQAGSGTIDALQALREKLAQDPQSLGLAVRQLLAQNSHKHLLLVIDQFEELFTLCRSAEERQAFSNCLTSVVDPNDHQPVTIVITLRADFYAQVARFEGLREWIAQHQEFIGAMNRSELFRAIVQPLAQEGWKIQEGLVEVILDDVGYEPGALPLLSHALLETWKRRRGRTLTLSGYNEAGGVRGAIAQTAETVFLRRLSPEQQPIARMIFIRLAELSDDAQDTRRRAEFSELITRSTDELMIEVVLDILTDSRLVTLDTVEPGSVRVVEVAHEALIREWSTLRNWLETDRQALILHRQLTNSTQDWIKLNRDSGLLYRGARLAQVQDWLQSYQGMLSLQEQEFIDKSRLVAQQEAEQAKRLARSVRNQRIAYAAIAGLVLTIIILILTGSFLQQQEPPRMSGFYNIAVAQFNGETVEGNKSDASPGNNPDLSQLVYQELLAELDAYSNIVVWHDSPELARQQVAIGQVAGSDPSAQAQAAQQMAERLNADMIVYGRLIPESAPQEVQLQLWLTPNPEFNSFMNVGLEGNFEFGDPIPLSDPAFLASQLAQQTKASAWVALGLAEENLGHSLESLEAFTRAESYSEWDLIPFLRGQAALFLVDRETIPASVKDAFEQTALQAFEKALNLNPKNVRALVGLGSIYQLRAQLRMLSIQGQYRGESIPLDPELMGYLGQALNLFQQALDFSLSTLGEAAVSDFTRLGLGVNYRLRGEAYFYSGQATLAEGDFDRAIQLLEERLAPLESTGQGRVLAQAIQTLGSAYFWKGFLYEQKTDITRSLELYQKASEYYRQCVALGASSTDLIVKNDTAEKRCSPELQQVEERIELIR
jgi:tetratricopeptide (TPR) repeat protein